MVPAFKANTQKWNQIYCKKDDIAILDFAAEHENLS